MLNSGHPHTWNVDHADEHLPVDFRRRYMAEESRLVVTPQMRQLAEGMPSALDRCAAIALSGPIGSGKSTTLAAVAAVAGVNTAIVNIPPGATPRQQWQEITTAITGQPATGTARQIQDAAREYLTVVPTLLIADEAQHIGIQALMQFRWLWDHQFPQFAIVLAGSDLFTHLDQVPSIASRIDRRIPLRHHSRARMLNLIRAHHPQAATTDPVLLEQIDDAYAHGSWRAWSKLLLCLANDFKHNGPITYERASDAILTITGTAPALLPAGAR